MKIVPAFRFRAWMLAPVLAAAMLCVAAGPARAEDRIDPVVSTQEMLSRLAQPWVQLIDVRSADEYAARDIRTLRGGHIPGAINLPASDAGEWTGAAAAQARVAALDRRKETIVYGHDAELAGRVAARLRAQGFRQVRVYADAWQHWGNDFQLPVAGERPADVGAMRDELRALQQQLARLAPQAGRSR